MISRLAIHNFKSLHDVQIDLERFTIFVGPNASGKSSILQSCSLLCPSTNENAESVLLAELRAGATRGTTDHIEVLCEWRGEAHCFRALISADETPSRPGRHGWTGEGRGIAAKLNSAKWKGPILGRPPLPLSVLLRLEATKLMLPGEAPMPSVMAPDGSGLHSALANMALNDPDSWQKLQIDLRQVIPSIRRLRHTLTTANQPPALLFDTINADSLDASQVSEGTLLVLGLLAALYGKPQRNLLLLDDLDRGLHPRAQKELITLLRELLKTNPDLQFVAATHSPYMLDCMETSEVRMTLLGDDGWTVCAPLASHPDFERWKDEMTPGEMWSMFGEKWIGEKRLVEEGAAT